MHAAAVLAHQGGWDEIVMVAVPVMVFGGLLALARRRAIKLAEAAEATDSTGATD
jgi:hypothetical protein